MEHGYDKPHRTSGKRFSILETEHGPRVRSLSYARCTNVGLLCFCSSAAVKLSG